MLRSATRLPLLVLGVAWFNSAKGIENLDLELDSPFCGIITLQLLALVPSEGFFVIIFILEAPAGRCMLLARIAARSFA